jgi:hypothetical protein
VEFGRKHLFVAEGKNVFSLHSANAHSTSSIPNPFFKQGLKREKTELTTPHSHFSLTDSKLNGKRHHKGCINHRPIRFLRSKKKLIIVVFLSSEKWWVTKDPRQASLHNHPSVFV